MIHKSEQINEIAKALAAAQSEMKAAKKDATNPFFKSGYATLESVSDACLPALNKHGIAVTQTTARLGDGSLVTLETTLIHSSGQWIGSVYPVHPTKNDPQSLGSAITYARRYSLAAIAGVTVSDDDGEAATQEYRQAHTQTKSAAPGAIAPRKTTSSETGSTHPSEAQLTRLFAIAKKSNWSTVDVKDYISQLGIESTKDLNYSQYESLCDKMQKFPKAKAVDKHVQ